MFRSKILPAVLAVMMTAGASTMALAAGHGKAEEGKAIHALMSVKVTADQAISAAEQDTHGQAFEFRLKEEKGHAVYEVMTLAKDKLVTAFVDPETGKVIRTGAGHMGKHETKAELSQFTKSPTNLTTAVATAEKETGGKALAGAFKETHGHSMIGVKVAKGSAMHWVTVDGATGKVVKVAEHHQKSKAHESKAHESMEHQGTQHEAPAPNND